MNLTYLAAPYTHPDPKVIEARVKKINHVAGELLRQGCYVFSPISHTHPIAVEVDLPKGFDFWEAYDELMLSKCTHLLVLKLPGWETSKGVTAEIKIAQRLGLKIDYINQ